MLIEDYALISKQRLNAANEARDDYDFGVQTTGLGDWFADEPDHWFTPVYAEGKAYSLHVCFEAESATTTEVYAYDGQGEPVGFIKVAEEDITSSTTLALYHALRGRWIAAGKPGCATEMCLWEMERLLSYTDKTGHSFKETLTEGIDLLQAWIEGGDEQTEAERIALEMANKFVR